MKDNDYIHFTDEEIESTTYTIKGKILTLDGKEYIIRRAIDNSKGQRGFQVVEK